MKKVLGIFGLCFKTYIALVFSVTLLIYYVPILLLKSSEKTKKHTFYVFILWSWSFRVLTFIHVRYRKRAQIPEGPYIIVSNHTSYLDIFLLYSIIPKHPFLFMGKAEILNYPLVKTYFKKLNIPVYRNNRLKSAKSYIHAKKAIEQGWSLVIFPEGGIPDTNHPVMIPFKDGAFKLAKATNVPIVPITFSNNYKLFSDPTEILGPARPGLSDVYLHEAVSKETVKESSLDELSSLVFNIINKAIEQKKDVLL